MDFDRFETVSGNLSGYADTVAEGHLEEAIDGLQEMISATKLAKEIGMPLNNRSYPTYDKLLAAINETQAVVKSAQEHVTDLWDCLMNDQLTPEDDGFVSRNNGGVRTQ